MELPLSRLSATLGVCARRTASQNILVGQYHNLLQQRRFESEEFKQHMHQRDAIEGTICELSCAHGLRRSCYRGFAKVQLQNLFIASACNIKRWLRIAAAALSGTKRALLMQICHYNGYSLLSIYSGNRPFKRDPCMAWRAFSRRYASHRERWLRCGA
jgi:Transposase DDE domain